MEQIQYYAHGKLLITGEYSVLDGALALALPCKLGQSLTIKTELHLNGVQWNSWDINHAKWLGVSFNEDLQIIQCSDLIMAKRLQEILKIAIELNPSFKDQLQQCRIDTKLEFDKNWGLGSSSTLIYLISEWAQVNPYELLSLTFKGSGYDIACANASQAITYKKQDLKPEISLIDFNPKWINHAYFIFLGQKQISSNEIKKYALLEFDRRKLALQITKITQQLLTCQDISSCQQILDTHETLLSKTLGYPTVKSLRFSNIDGTFKSLGAWGGDFVLFIGDQNQIPEIQALGYSVIIPWKDLALTS
jgi:mevalonate kinase